MFATLELVSHKSYRMKLSIIGFIRLLPKMIMFLGVVAIYYGFYAIVLVALYQQEDYECINYSESVSINNIQDCFYWGGDWVELPFSSKYSFMTLINLIIVSLTETWGDFITTLSQARGQNYQPITDANN